VEGLAAGGVLTRVQEAFLQDGAFQCGFCTSGMILLVTALLARHPNPDDATVRQWLSSNICRCTGYNSILAAVRRASAGLRTEAAA
jgi:carbon-monoxide dehydrogenase small subunit